MEPVRRVTGPAAPILANDINTDQILPAAYLKDLHADLAAGLFGYMRRHPDGTRNDDFVLERPQFHRAPILVVGNNFGCGSSREQTVWALRAFGVQCVIGHSLGEFFRDNCLRNGLVPVVLPEADMARLSEHVVAIDGHQPFSVDLESCEITGPDEFTCDFHIAEHERTALLEGLDDIGLTLKHLDEIRAWERRISADRPFLQSLMGVALLGEREFGRSDR